MSKTLKKTLALLLAIGMFASLFAAPISVNAVPAADETYYAFDIIEYSDLLDTGNNHLSSSGVTLSSQNTIYHYNVTSETHSVIYKFRWVAGACTYAQMYPGEYCTDPFMYRINTGASATWQKRYAPGNTSVSAGSITSGDEFDIEIGRLKVLTGTNAGKYYSYFKVDGTLIFEVYVQESEITDAKALKDSIQFALGGTYDCGLKPIPDSDPDALYYDYDEIGYGNLLYNGSLLGDETSMGSKLFTYNRTSKTYSAILKFRWKAVAGSKFQISFDRKGTDNAINYMFGAQFYTAGSEGKTNDSLRLRPGLDDANAWNELSENIVDGEYYNVEFARLKVKNGANAGKYYMYFKLNDVMISESYVATGVVDSSGNYTSNPGSTACHLSNEIYLTFWGASGNKLSAIPEPETYDAYDVVTYYDLLSGGSPVTAERTSLSGNPKFAYNRTSPSYSVILKYRWIAGETAHFVFFFDAWGGSGYPFALAAKGPNYSSLGAAAGPNGAWHLVPNNASHIVQMSEPIAAGETHDIEHARLKVVTGPNAGKYYVYVKVDGELICGYYYDGDNGDGTYGSGSNIGTFTDNYLRFTGATADNYISETPNPDVYEEADEVWYTDLSYNGSPVSSEGSGSGKTYTYNKTTTYGSAILKLRWKNANPATQFQISFDRKGTDNAINYMFGVQLYLATSDANYPNGLVWLRPGYGPKAELPEPIQSGENYDIEFARLKVIGGRNTGKYYMYLKINDVLIAEDYVAANIVDSEGNYSSKPNTNDALTPCHISNEMYITFWGGGGATITNPAYTETYYDYDEVGYDDLSVGGSPVPSDKRAMSGGTTLTYNRTSDTGSVVFKYRWTVGDVAKFQMSFDEKAGAEHNNMEYMFGAWLSNPGDTYANGDMYLRPGYGSHVALASALTPGGKYDIEYGRLKVATGPNREKYYVYIKINDELIDSAYVAANVVDSSGNYTTNPGSVQCNVKAGEIFMAFWGSNGNEISSSLVDAYDTPDEVYYSDLSVGGTPVARERSGNAQVYTYTKTSDYGSAILKLRWKNANPQTQFQMSFDRKGSSDAINYMFGVQLYSAGADANYPDGYVWLRPGYGPKAELTEAIQSGENYDIEFARIKILLGPNKGKYYMYFKLNNTLLAEDYVAADVVDGSGNYTSNPGSTACSLSNEIFITFWGGGGATITDPEDYAEYDEIGYGDLLYSGDPLPGRAFSINNNKVIFTYNRTSDTYSSVLKYRWVAGDPAKFSLSFDTNGSNDVSYPFCAVAKYPNQSGYGATAGANGAWQIDPTQDSLLVNMSSPIVAGNPYDIEFGRLKVISGPYTGKYFVYLKVDGTLIQSRYYQVNNDGTYNSTSLSNNIVLSIYSSSGNQILAYGAPLSVSHVGRVGDFNNDGSVGTIDFTKFSKLLLGAEDLGEMPETILDYNNDSKVDICDYVSMKKQFLLSNSYAKSGSLQLGMQEHLLEDETKTAAYIADASATIGAGAYRLSMPIHNLYYVTAVNGVGVRSDNMAKFKAQIAALKAQGINEILYVTDSFILPYGYTSSVTSHNKTVPNPSNDMTNYTAWLTVNATAFKELAEECPEIKYFEPFNEINLSDTHLEKPGCAWDASSSEHENYRYTTAERAGIMADLCWYVTRAVKSVDILNQVTTPSIAVGSAGIIESGFLNTFYNEIESGNYPRGNALSDKRKDNFFTIINIHTYPEYSTSASTRTTNVNNAATRIGNNIYDVMQNHTDGCSRVWLTETGISIDPQRSESYGADLISKFLNKINTNLTYIDTVFFYKVADISSSAGAGDSETYYGLFYSGDNATASKRYGAKQTAKAVYSFFHNGSTDYTALDNLKSRYAS